MSLLTLIQAVAREIGVTSPTTAYANSDPQIIQLVALAQEEGIELARRHPWAKLTKEKTFTGTAAAVQTGAIPADFDRFIDESFFNRTKKREVHGPITPQEWQYAQSVVATVLVESFRVRGSDILITPSPAGTETYAYEYISTQWCESSGGTDQSTWAADADVGLLSENLMKLGVIWRFLKAKGFDYGEAFRTYELQVGQVYGREGGRRTVSSASRTTDSARRPAIPEGDWAL